MNTLGWLFLVLLLAVGCADGAADGGMDAGGQPLDEGDAATPTEPANDRDGDGYQFDLLGSRDDCDDEDPAIHPEAEESCDGFDQDCDGKVDEETGNGCAFDCTAKEPCEAPMKIVAGDAHTCVLTDAGNVYCWGWNRSGQLGTLEVPMLARPQRVLAVKQARDVDAADEVTCALIDDHAVCWGRGDKLPYEQALPADTVELAVGWNLLCARSKDGALRCGVRHAAAEAFVTMYASAGSPAVVDAIDVGYDSLCATLTTGALVCWTSPNVEDADIDIAVAITAMRPAVFAMGASGGGEGGDALCYVANAQLLCRASLGVGDGVVPGNGAAVQLGLGYAQRCARDAQQRVACWAGFGDGVIADITQLAVGDEHACGIRADGRVVCWGHRNNGALGDGAIDGSSTSVPVEIVASAPLPLHDDIPLLGPDARGACDNPDDFATIRVGTARIHAAVASCTSSCTASLDSAACFADCVAGAVALSEPCLGCFIDFASCSGEACQAALETCAGYPVDFVSIFADYQLNLRCASSDGACYATGLLGDRCTEARFCMSGQCQDLPHRTGAPVCIVPDGAGCNADSAYCRCSAGTYCGGCWEDGQIASAPDFRASQCYRECTTENLCGPYSTCTAFSGDSGRRFCD